jgi:hypothetical protein
MFLPESKDYLVSFLGFPKTGSTGFTGWRVAKFARKWGHEDI